MSDADYFGPATPEPTGDAASIEQGLRELRERRAIAEVSGPPPDDEQEPQAPPRVSDGKDHPLTLDEAKKIPGKAREQQWRLDQERRALAYREGLSDPATPDAGQDAAGQQPSPSSESPPDPLADERVAIEQQRAAIEQERAHYQQEAQAAQWLTTLSATERELWVAEQNSAQRLQAVATEFNGRYSDIAAHLNNPAAMAQLQAQDPARHAQLLQDCGVLQNEAAQYQQAQQYRAQVSQQREAAGATQFAKAAELHDAAWMAAHPELSSDPAKLREVQEHAVKYLTSKGLSQAELEAHWHGRASFSLRERISQDILLDAVRWQLAQQHLQESRSAGRSLPPTLRPGTRDARDGDSAHAQLENARRQLDRASTSRAGIEAGVAAMRAQRALRSR